MPFRYGHIETIAHRIPLLKGTETRRQTLTFELIRRAKTKQNRKARTASDESKEEKSICNWMRLMLNFLQIYNEKTMSSSASMQQNAHVDTFASFPLSPVVVVGHWLDRVKIINFAFLICQSKTNEKKTPLDFFILCHRRSLTMSWNFFGWREKKEKWNKLQPFVIASFVFPSLSHELATCDLETAILPFTRPARASSTPSADHLLPFAAQRHKCCKFAFGANARIRKCFVRAWWLVSPKRLLVRTAPTRTVREKKLAAIETIFCINHTNVSHRGECVRKRTCRPNSNGPRPGSVQIVNMVNLRQFISPFFLVVIVFFNWY